MKTIKQIKQLVENIAISCNGDEKSIDSKYVDAINTIRDAYLPAFQFNIDGTSSAKAQELISIITKNITIIKSYFG